MTKIIGFLITKENLIPEVDFFKVGIKTSTIKHNSYNIHLWGIGDIENYKINDRFSLSFPLHDSLLDRNILISFDNDKIIVENDWLGSIPIFYNKKGNIVSTLSNFCLKDKTIHNEGLANFCEFGYSVFEQTMFTDVKFMRYFSKLKISDKIIEIEYRDDPVLESSFLAKESNENEVINLMQNYIWNIESKIDGDIVLPTSGGYDSRILNYFIKDKSRIRSFTYGISKDQSQSSEVVHAKKISEIYKIQWKQIELKEYHKYMDNWASIYGYSTHLHGMYHIEFYENISKKYDFSNSSFLSGIFGDIWAGSINYKDIEKYQDIINLGYTHGMNLDLKYLDSKSNDALKKEYFNVNGEFLKNNKIKSIFTIRMKLMLISYLTQIPEYFGMPVWTSFLNFEIVKETLTLPDDRRKNRVWQKDFFKKVGLNLEDMNLKSVKSNKLDYGIAKNVDFEPIDINTMKKYIKQTRLIEINNILSKLSISEIIKNQLLYISKVGGVLRRLGFKNKFLNALYEYYVIKAIEIGLKYES